MTPHSTHLLSLDLVLIKLVNQVAWAGIGHMNTENQEEEEEAQQGETGHYLGLTHPDNRKFKFFATKSPQRFGLNYLQNLTREFQVKLTKGNQNERFYLPF